MIEKIKDDGGREFVDDPNIGRVLGDYFSGLFTSSSPSGVQEAIALVGNKISAVHLEVLLEPFTKQDVEEALFRMHPTKAPGLDESYIYKFIAWYKVAQKAHVISYLLFADDIILFARAIVQEADCISDILNTYENASGQVINLEKSMLSVSRNVLDNSFSELKQLLGVKAVESFDKYLGLPTIIGKSKSQIFNFVKDRVWKKLKGWKEKFLSCAGREVLIKSFVQAIPSYVMSCFVLPDKSCAEIDAMIANFFWGGDATRRGLHWVKWSTMCRHKNDGGLGFCDFKTFNLSLVGKNWWRIYSQPSSLLAQVFKAVYFPRTNIWDARRGYWPSYAWSSIWKSKIIFEKGVRWRIGSGKKPNGGWNIPILELVFAPVTVKQTLECKELAWRAIKGVLPVRHSLKVRGVDLDDALPFCGTDSETSDHVLVRCPAVQPLWFASPLAVRVAFFSSMMGLVSAFLSTAEEEPIAVFQTWVYALWEARNSLIFDGRQVSMDKLLQRVAGLLASPQPCPSSVVHDRRRLASSWTRPRQGTMKVNVDASYRDNEGATYGMVVRNYLGEVLAAAVSHPTPAMSALLAEAQGLRWSMVMVRELGFMYVCLETDSLQVYNAWNCSSGGSSYLVSVLVDCHILASHFTSVSISFVRHTGNAVFGYLARHASSYPGFVWLEEAPNEVLPLVDVDVLAFLPRST
ncbi:uncharacterized protein LOC130749083 [Lotus japonicus]|uniref:uncharacterized protein LOC130749083 n=1 Tax=Lotus japonicus TaxID=34305 RepID=UPI00258C9303|nr:uncharacterized protein LOC130749083 [Lotus japonicus]